MIDNPPIVVCRREGWHDCNHDIEIVHGIIELPDPVIYNTPVVSRNVKIRTNFQCGIVIVQRRRLLSDIS